MGGCLEGLKCLAGTLAMLRPALLVTLNFLILPQGPRGKPGLPGMPGSDGSPVSGPPLISDALFSSTPLTTPLSDPQGPPATLHATCPWQWEVAEGAFPRPVSFVRSQEFGLKKYGEGYREGGRGQSHTFLPYPQGHPGKEGPPGTKGNQVRSSPPPPTPEGVSAHTLRPHSPRGLSACSMGSDAFLRCHFRFLNPRGPRPVTPLERPLSLFPGSIRASGSSRIPRTSRCQGTDHQTGRNRTAFGGPVGVFRARSFEPKLHP